MWLYRAAFGVVLSAIWSDLDFVHDFGISESDFQLLDTALSVASDVFDRDATNSNSYSSKFEEFRLKVDLWNELRSENRSLSYWNLKRAGYLQSRLGRAVSKNKNFKNSLDPVKLKKAFSALLEVGVSSPGTFYTVFSLQEYFENVLPRCTSNLISNKKLIRIVYASVPIYHLIRRDIDALYSLSPSERILNSLSYWTFSSCWHPSLIQRSNRHPLIMMCP